EGRVTEKFFFYPLAIVRSSLANNILDDRNRTNVYDEIHRRFPFLKCAYQSRNLQPIQFL
ncbi:MAG TPA: hypothetical protein PKW59_12670, partial [Thermotogota bacterium]|nr:hypothetical protein [Thermotogota bacterium]